MRPDLEGSLATSFFFTAPWDPVIVRRGDPLGLRPITEVFADAVAPDLSNRIRDARWITILSWCLVRSQAAFHASGGREVVTREQQRQRYAWLRPLELMWIVRTMDGSASWRGRSLPGQRRVRRWVDDNREHSGRYGLSPDQFRAYRQTGSYGAYRLGFRYWPDMSVGGDGFTPGPAARQLARWLDSKLGTARPASGLNARGDDDGALSGRSAKLRVGNEPAFWADNWPNYREKGRAADDNTLPRPNAECVELAESALLRPVLFGDDVAGRRRLAVARVLSESRASSHAALCGELGSAFANDPLISRLPAYSAMADAAMVVLEFIADALRTEVRVSVNDIASQPGIDEACEDLRAACRHWQAQHAPAVRHMGSAHRLAEVFTDAKPLECVRAMAAFHERHGGGLRWFAMRDDCIEARSLPGGRRLRYGYRLWPLSRLAVQCGVVKQMPTALSLELDAGADDAWEDDDV